MGQMVAYVRVSSATQNTERQDFRGYKLDQVFTDKASGGSTNRPALQECMTYLRDGDTLLVHSIDRLARSNKDLQDITHELRSKGVILRFIKENLTFDDSPQSELMLTVMGAMASFERSLIRERQRTEEVHVLDIGGHLRGESKVHILMVIHANVVPRLYDAGMALLIQPDQLVGNPLRQGTQMQFEKAVGQEVAGDHVGALHDVAMRI